MKHIDIGNYNFFSIRNDHIQIDVKQVLHPGKILKVGTIFREGNRFDQTLDPWVVNYKDLKLRLQGQLGHPWVELTPWVAWYLAEWSELHPGDLQKNVKNY